MGRGGQPTASQKLIQQTRTCVKGGEREGREREKGEEGKQREREREREREKSTSSHTTLAEVVEKKLENSNGLNDDYLVACLVQQIPFQ